MRGAGLADELALVPACCLQPGRLLHRLGLGGRWGALVGGPLGGNVGLGSGSPAAGAERSMGVGYKTRLLWVQTRRITYVFGCLRGRAVMFRQLLVGVRAPWSSAWRTLSSDAILRTSDDELTVSPSVWTDLEIFNRAIVRLVHVFGNIKTFEGFYSYHRTRRPSGQNQRRRDR